MSKVPMGKVLFRNVIRHTNAHNKIQEESEMWKMRQWEKEVSHPKLNLSPAAEFTTGRMHCDRVSNDSRDRSRSHERTSGHNEREARYWTRRLYEFEAGDPDRWGHSGFKELYPEEFENDGEKEGGNKRNGRRKKNKSKSSLEAATSRHSKKSSRHKKKKKRKKKEEKRKGADGSSSDGSSSSDESDAARCKQKRKRTKSKHKSKKSERSRGREDDSGSEESDEGEREKRTNSRKKRKLDFHQSSDLGRKRRKNWKVVNEEKSDETSGD